MNARRLVIVAALGLLALVPTPASAARRYVGSYSAKYQARGYNYRTYSYYSAKYRSYRMHYAVYYPRNRYVYYYNPHTKKYWGRYDTATGKYSKLADKDKAGTIGQIPESAFPAGGSMPEPEPGAGGLMLPPPENLGSGNGPVAPRTGGGNNCKAY